MENVNELKKVLEPCDFNHGRFRLAFLTLFFIPSTVAVINYPELLTASGGLLILAVIISTIISIVVTGKVSKVIEKKEQQKKEDGELATVTTNSVHHK